MTTIEKGILGTMAVLIVAIGAGVTYTVSAVNEAGGLKAVVIEAGKEVKDIANEIAKD